VNTSEILPQSREPDKQALLRILRYIMPNKGEGIIFRPENCQDMELSCGADFCGNWRTEIAHWLIQPLN